jgi:hypothetical protein
MQAAVSDRLRLKLAAVAIAVLVWFIITSRESRWETRVVRFEPVMDSALVLRGRLPEIRASIVGRADELEKLGNTPLVMRRQIAATEGDTVVVHLRADDVELPSGVLATIREFRPSQLTLRFEPSWSRQVPVQAAVRVARTDGAPPVSVALDPASVEISGPSAAVMRVPFLRTDSTVLSAADTIPVLVALDTAGLGVRVRPAQVKIRVVPAPPPPPPDSTRPPQ